MTQKITREDVEIYQKQLENYDDLIKQKAIEFVEWIDGEGWRQIAGGKWYNTISHKYKVTDYFTTGELYKKFKEENK